MAAVPVVAGKMGHLAVLLGPVLVLLSAPGHVAAVQFESAPAGLLAVIGSFILFGVGTLGAMTKLAGPLSDVPGEVG